MFKLKQLLYFFFIQKISETCAYEVIKNRIYDSFGRERVFHGTNVIYKTYPWHPLVNNFDYKLSFNDDDITLLSNLGLNVIRLGVMWPGVEPIKGEYNMTYLNLMKKIVKKLEKNNINVIVEFHQDALSSYFCGEGIPDWVVKENLKILGSSFPYPLARPYNKTGKPTKSQCDLREWWKYQFSYKLSEMYQSLYTNKTVFGYFVSYWQILSETFKDSNNVIGYEIINEPWAGNIYRNPLLLVPQIADQKNLQDFYNKIYTKISDRLISDKKLFFFEGVTWDNIGTGFDKVPGGDTSQCVLAYHGYFPPNLSVDRMFNIRAKDKYKLGIASFMTEFGSPKNLSYILDQADSWLQSWAIWQYKSYAGITGDGSAFFNKDGSNSSNIPYLYRIYPQAVCGRIINFNYNLVQNTAKLLYENNPKCTAETEIFMRDAKNITIFPSGVYFKLVNNSAYISPHKELINVSIIIY